MSSPDLQTAVIACPNCGTRYQLPRAAIGAAGREVQCAQCGKSWHAMADLPLPVPALAPVSAPPPAENDALFGETEEAELDAAFEAAQKHAEPPRGPGPEEIDLAEKLATMHASLAADAEADKKLDPAALKQSRRAFERRQRSISRGLPMARMRRTARAAAAALLVAILGLGFVYRTDLVRVFPSLAGLYAALGMPVNVVGLDFEDANTLMTLRSGNAVMQITARIKSVSSATVQVPPVLVSLLDADGDTIYEWTVTPEAADMEPGELLDFKTEVNSPPPAASSVRLSFTTPRGSAALGKIS